MPKRFTIYCDESADKGPYFSDFYGGALIRTADREAIEAVLSTAKADAGLVGEAKWTKIGPHNEKAYIEFVDSALNLVAANRMKLRVMFTQNINQTQHLDHDDDNRFFILYYQFIKNAFGLRYCNPERAEEVIVTVLLDDAPDTRQALENFKNYLSSLSVYPIFHRERIKIPRDQISEIRSHDHVILQAVDVVLGAMQFRLNEFHKRKPEGQRLRGARTRAKERVYKHINSRIRGIYPRFNIGTSTGQSGGPADRWDHSYRHWCFVPEGSIKDLSRGKRQK
ncbi:MAG: DUF3800 domain-containing protein [Alphaproteobacteria bacterium]|nr:DUF3800 domain-containing protein [Alphaproteobacteria bacterium]